MEQYNNLVEALEDLKKRGFDLDFSLLPDCLYCASVSLKINPEEFTIVETYRFEGNDSSPDNNAVIYVISSNGGFNKGVPVDAYGTYADALTPEMAKKLKSNP